MNTSYSVIWSQYTELMRQRIQALPEYIKMYSDDAHVHSLRQSETRLLISNHKTTLHRHCLKQQIDWDNSTGSKHVMSKVHGQIWKDVDVVINIAGSVPVYPSLVDAALKGKNLERDKAMCFMLGANIYQFGKLIEDLENQNPQGTTTLASALGLINNWEIAPKLITKVI